MPRPKLGSCGGLAAALGGSSSASAGGAGGSSLLNAVLGSDASLDADAQLLLRKLAKKAPETKIKALGELREAIASRSPEWGAPLLPHWTLIFARLADDASWQVREQACVALGLLAQQLRRQLAPHLKQLILPWLRCRFDAQHDVRRAACSAFASAFPGSGKYTQALAFCHEELCRTIAEHTTAKPPARTGDEDTDVEARDMFTRRLATSLQVAAHIVQEAAAASPSQPPADAGPAAGGGGGTGSAFTSLCTLLELHVLTPELWRLASSKAATVRCALYVLCHTLLQHAPQVVETMRAPIATTLLDGLSEQDVGAHAVLWNPLLLLLRAHPDALQHSPSGRHILARLVSLLRHGCYGAAPVVAEALLPLASLLPSELIQPGGGGSRRRVATSDSDDATLLSPAAQLLDAIWDGLRGSTNSKNEYTLPVAHFPALLRSHAELTRLLLVSADTATKLSAAASAVLNRGLQSPLNMLLHGSLPPRLRSHVALEALCGSIVALAASAKCTAALEAYIPTLISTCRNSCLDHAKTACPIVAEFLCRLHKMLRQRMAEPSSKSAAHDGGRANCQVCASALSRHVGQFWRSAMLQLDDAAMARSLDDDVASWWEQMLLALAKSYGLCSLWAAATLAPPLDPLLKPRTVPVTWLLPSNSDPVSGRAVALRTALLPADALALTAVPGLMNTLIMPWARASLPQSQGSVAPDNRPGSSFNHADSLYALVVMVFRELGVAAASSSSSIAGFASELIHVYWGQLVGEFVALSTPCFGPLSKLIGAVTTTCGAERTWDCAQLDDEVMRAARAALAPSSPTDYCQADDDSCNAALTLVESLVLRPSTLSDKCFTMLIDLTATSISAVIGRRSLPAHADLRRLGSAYRIAAAVSQQLSTRDVALTSKFGEATIRAVSELLLSLFATVVVWRPASAWLRERDDAMSDSAYWERTRALDLPRASWPEDLFEPADHDEFEDALVREAADVEPSVAHADEAGFAEEEAIADAESHDDAAADIDEMLATVEAAARDVCGQSAAIWKQMAPLVADGSDSNGHMGNLLTSMSRLKASVVPDSFGYAERWRDGARRWAWATMQLSAVALPSISAKEACCEVSDGTWRSVMLRHERDAGDEGSPVELWRLCALSLALLRHVDLQITFTPRGGEDNGGFKSGPYIDPHVLVWLLNLFHASVGTDGDSSNVSKTLPLDLSSFVCSRLLPFLRSLGVPHGRPPSLLVTLTRIAVAFITPDSNALRLSPLMKKAAADTFCTLLRCVLCGSTAALERMEIASSVLAGSGLPNTLSALQKHEGSRSLLMRITHIIGSTHATADSGTAASGTLATEASEACAFLTNFGDEARIAVLALRPAASTASRAALARLGQTVSAADESRELLHAACILFTYADLQMAVVQSRVAPPSDADAILEHCQKLDAMRRSTDPSTSVEADALRSALCEALGAYVRSVVSPSPMVLLGHAKWILPLLDESVRSAAAATASKASSSSSDTFVATRHCHPFSAVIRGSAALLAALKSAAISAAAVAGADVTTAPSDGTANAAAAAAAAVTARLDRLSHQILTWVLAHGVPLGGRRGSQSTLLVALKTAAAIPAASLPTGCALAPLGALVAAHDPRVRSSAMAILSRIPRANASIPAVGARSSEPPPAGDTDDEMLQEAQLEAIFSLPLLETMRMLCDPHEQQSSTSACFCAWAVALELHGHFEPAARARISAHWKHELLKPGSSIDALLHALLDALPLASSSAPSSQSPSAAEATDGKPPLQSDKSALLTLREHHTVGSLCEAHLKGGFSAPAPSEGEIAACLYLQLLRSLPSLVRYWWTHAIGARGARGAKKDLEKLTQVHYSPILLKQEMEAMASAIGADGDTFRVRGSVSTRQIAATYTCEGSALQISLQLPLCHPLMAVEVECVHRIGVTEKQWRLWQRQISTMLLSQNGTISAALLTWKENVDKVFEGVEECPICYMVVHASTGHLPKLECKTCHNKFHSACLYKWFSSAQKSLCPLCQTAF